VVDLVVRGQAAVVEAVWGQAVWAVAVWGQVGLEAPEVREDLNCPRNRRFGSKQRWPCPLASSKLGLAYCHKVRGVVAYVRETVCEVPARLFHRKAAIFGPNRSVVERRVPFLLCQRRILL